MKGIKMKKKIIQEEFDYMSDLSFCVEEKLRKFPLLIPVVLHNIEIGNIKIDFEYNKERKTPKDEELEYNFIYTFLMILNELEGIAPLIKKDIELIAKMVTRYEKKERKFLDLISFLDGPNIVSYIPPWYFFYMKEEEIFELIKSEGPITLCNSVIQNRINKWLSEKDSAGVKINKLKDSLLEYALESSPKERPFKLGRPRISLLNTLDPKLIINTYRDISTLLKIAKRNEKNYKGNIRESIRKAEKEFMLSKKRDPKWQSAYKRSIKDKEFDFFDLIWSCIENDSRLTKAFESFLWQPNNFAKKVLARLLDVSESTIDKYISRKLTSS